MVGGKCRYFVGAADGAPVPAAKWSKNLFSRHSEIGRSTMIYRPTLFGNRVAARPSLPSPVTEQIRGRFRDSLASRANSSPVSLVSY